MKKTSPIKLLEIEPLSDGTRRFQSQLYVGRLSADFIIEPDGTAKMWSATKKGCNFIPFCEAYQICTKEQISNQPLNQ